jgi:hypothetical protein
MKCEDYPCCGHGPVSTGGDGGGCPDAEGRFNCVLCGAKLEKNAGSSICSPCRKLPSSEHRHFADEPEDDGGEWDTL